MSGEELQKADPMLQGGTNSLVFFIVCVLTLLSQILSEHGRLLWEELNVCMCVLFSFFIIKNLPATEHHRQEQCITWRH